jgi:hypothetical protein
VDYSKPVRNRSNKHPLAGIDFGQDQEGYAQGRQPWLEQIKAHPPNTTILGLAEQLLLLHDKDLAEGFLKGSQTKELNNPRWAERLGAII